jgi:hypothetical protein
VLSPNIVAGCEDFAEASLKRGRKNKLANEWRQTNGNKEMTLIRLPPFVCRGIFWLRLGRVMSLREFL